MQVFLAAFESVPDPRADNVRHDLVEILISRSSPCCAVRRTARRWPNSDARNTSSLNGS